MSRAGRVRRPLLGASIIAGLALLGIGVGAALLRSRLTHPEKKAYYVLGHWVDAFWEVQVPLLVIGVATLVVAAWCTRRR